MKHKINLIMQSIIIILLMQLTTIGYAAGNIPIHPGGRLVIHSGAEITFTDHFDEQTEFRINGSIVIDGGMLSVSGTSSTKIYLSKNWTNFGIFNCGCSTVTFFDPSVVSTISGDTTFYNLTSITPPNLLCNIPGKEIKFTAGTNQTIKNLLTLIGKPEKEIKLRSTEDGEKWDITLPPPPGGSQTVSFVDVKDSDANTNTITAYNSINSGNNNKNWKFIREIKIVSITPISGVNTGIISMTIIGEGFGSKVDVRLINPEMKDIIATNVNVISPGTLTCVFDLTGVSPGTRTVMVTNVDGESQQSARLNNSFYISGYYEVKAICYYATGGNHSEHQHIGVDSRVNEWIELKHTSDWVAYHVNVPQPIAGIQLFMANGLDTSVPVSIFVNPFKVNPPEKLGIPSHDSKVSAEPVSKFDVDHGGKGYIHTFDKPLLPDKDHIIIVCLENQDVSDSNLYLKWLRFYPKQMLPIEPESHIEFTVDSIESTIDTSQQRILSDDYYATGGGFPQPILCHDWVGVDSWIEPTPAYPLTSYQILHHTSDWIAYHIQATADVNTIEICMGDLSSKPALERPVNIYIDPYPSGSCGIPWHDNIIDDSISPTITFNVTPGMTQYKFPVSLSPGEHILIIELGNGDSIRNEDAEVEKVRNLYIEYIEITEEKLPDLTLSPSDISFSFPDENPHAGDIVKITATIHNIGGTSATSTVVTFYDQYLGVKSTITTQIVTTVGSRTPFYLPPHGTHSISIEWTAPPGGHNIYVEISDTSPSESNIENNRTYKPIRVIPHPASLEEFFVTGDTKGNIHVYWSNMDGTFIYGGAIGNIGGTATVAMADFDNDRDFDIIAAEQNTTNIYLFKNKICGKKHGTFQPLEKVTEIQLSPDKEKVTDDAAVADFDNDGYYDVIFATDMGDKGRLYFIKNSRGKFGAPALIWELLYCDIFANQYIPGLTRFAGIDAGDFNEDGNMDILVVVYAGGLAENPVFLLEGDGKGKFKKPDPKQPIANAPREAMDGSPALTVGDFNNDRHDDFIIGHDDGEDAGAAWLYLGNGEKEFVLFNGMGNNKEVYDINEPDRFGYNQPGGGYAQAYDFDRDGILDIAAVANVWGTPIPHGGTYGTVFIKGKKKDKKPAFNVPERIDIYRGHSIATPPIPPTPKLHTAWMSNPDWAIKLSDAGYADVMIWKKGNKHEVLSGDWAAAVKFDGIENTGGDPSNPNGAQWLTPAFIRPDWHTGTPFKTFKKIETWDDCDNPVVGLDTGRSVVEIPNRVRIEIEYRMIDTRIGTPMGIQEDHPIMSNRYVLMQTYIITNMGRCPHKPPIKDFKFFQFLHSHPYGERVKAFYDDTFYPNAPYAAYHYDITHTGRTICGYLLETVGFSSPQDPPDYYGVGYYRSHGWHKPSKGLHLEVESGALSMNTVYPVESPETDEVAGAQGWVIPDFPRKGKVRITVLLSIQGKEDPRSLLTAPWQIPFSAITTIPLTGEKLIATATLGVGDTALDEFDQTFDEPLIPTIPKDKNYIQIYFPHTEWEEIFSKFTRDIRKWRELDTTGLKWEFDVRTNVENTEIIIPIPDLSKCKLPGKYTAVLTDTVSHRIYDLRTAIDPIVYNSGDAEKPRRFEVVIKEELVYMEHTFTKHWNMISIPVTHPLNHNPETVFSDRIIDKYYLYNWDGIDYQPVNKIHDTMKLGHGYWLGLLGTETVKITGRPTNAPFPLPVKAGWNMIGCPFTFVPDWTQTKVKRNNVIKTLSEAVDSGWVVNQLYTYKNGEYKEVSRIVPWSGYWFPVIEDCTLIILPIRDHSTRRLSAPPLTSNSPSQTEWSVELTVQIDKRAEDRSFLGMIPSALVGFDIHDKLEPPVPLSGEYVTCYFSHPEAKATVLRKLSSDIRPLSEQTMIWEVEVAANITGEATISWDRLPQGYEFIFRDNSTGKEIDMHKDREYTYVHQIQTLPARFQIEVKRRTTSKPVHPGGDKESGHLVQDVNNDTVVNIFDLVIIARSFGQSVPPAEARADVNKDGKVDIFDLVMVARHFGEKYGNNTTAPAKDAVTIAQISQTHAPDSTFTVDVTADEVSDVYGFEFELAFDPNVLEIVSVSEGAFLKNGDETTYWMQPVVDKKAGRITGACTRMGTKDGVSGSGVLASVTFRAKGYGMSSLQLKKILLASPQATPVQAQVKLAGSAPNLPASTNVLQNYPNPFNPECWIPYTLSERAHVIIKIYNITGQLIRTLDLGVKQPGIYVNKAQAAYWDGLNDDGEEVASGVYFYRLQAGDKVSTRKMVVLK